MSNILDKFNVISTSIDGGEYSLNVESKYDLSRQDVQDAFQKAVGDTYSVTAHEEKDEKFLLDIKPKSTDKPWNQFEDIISKLNTSGLDYKEPEKGPVDAYLKHTLPLSLGLWLAERQEQVWLPGG